MGVVATGALVLCLILKPSQKADSSAGQDDKPQIQKTLGIVKETFTKKVVRDSKNLRVALHEDKDMLVVETLDGEAQITIGADACKRVVEKDEYDTLKKKLEQSNPEEAKISDKNDAKKDEIIQDKPQSEKEKLDLLKELDK